MLGLKQPQVLKFNAPTQGGLLSRRTPLDRSLGAEGGVAKPVDWETFFSSNRQKEISAHIGAFFPKTVARPYATAINRTEVAHFVGGLK